MNATVVEWLTAEVEELLTVGTVGLYEFREILASSDFALDENGAQAVAKAVATDIVERNVAVICLLRWPRDDAVDGPEPLSVLDDVRAWGWLPAKLYFALIPVADLDQVGLAAGP